MLASQQQALLCKPDDGPVRPKHVAIKLKLVSCVDGYYMDN